MDNFDLKKYLAEGQLNEGQLSGEEATLKAKIYAQDFMNYFQKIRNVVRGNFGSEAEEKWIDEVKEKMKARLYSND